MRSATLVIVWIVRIAGIVQILLGLSIWIGIGSNLYSIHIGNGLLIVIGLWLLALLALVARGRAGLAGFALVWGLALPAFGMVQADILVGSFHWLVRVLHLLMGLIALATADALAKHVLTRAGAGTVSRR
ncbi:hypothetical protein ACQEVB_29485 [Pseudonocardia sp. CA-107938]|uniref:hypothetical protein n=1 Tax=Pseudonocardia sp. CA-107938 TaxID=3240021 RepID=UPI003D8CFFB3